MLFIWIGAVVVLLFGLTALSGAPYVPSHRRALRRAFVSLRPLTDKDLVVDIGSGDGVVLREVAKLGGRGYGIEINPVLVVISRLLNHRYSDKLRVRWASFWQVKFPDDTTIVYTFGDTRDIAKMFKKVRREATRIGRTIEFISYGFEVPGYAAAKEDGGCFLYQADPLQ